MRDADSQPAGERQDLALHETRKAAKRLRYATETATPALGKPARRLRRRLKTVQKLLGEHQDTVMSRPFCASSPPRLISRAATASPTA